MNETQQPAVAGPVEPTVRPLVDRLREAADVWGADDGGDLYAAAAEEIVRLREALRFVQAWDVRGRMVHSWYDSKNGSGAWSKLFKA
jgi:hypothetical protein